MAQPIKDQSIDRIAIKILFCLTVLWFLIIVLSRHAPEWDNMEELVWSSSFEWGYQKHPPLPTWIIYPFTMVFGRVFWLPFALGFACVLISQFVMFKLYTKICDQSQLAIPKEAPLVLTLIGTPLAYFTLRGGDFNHNSVQLWSIAAMFYCYYSAWLQDRGAANQGLKEKKYWLYWVLLGLMTGLAFISKYSVLIQILVLLSHFIWSKRFRNKKALIGLFTSLLIFIAVILPHLIWLLQATRNGTGPIVYAQSAMASNTTFYLHIKGLFLGFFITQFYRILPCFLFLILLITFANSHHQMKDEANNRAKTSTWWKRFSQEDRTFMGFIVLGPTIIALLIGIVFTQNIEAKWAVTFYIAIGLIGVLFAQDVNIKKFIKIACVMHLLIAALYGLFTGPIADYYGIQGRGNFPSKLLARQINLAWEQHPEITKGQPITLIAGDTWLVGNIIINDSKFSGRNMKAWIDADDKQSPWINSIDKDRPLLLLRDYGPIPLGKWWRGGKPASEKVSKLFSVAPISGIVSIPWTSKKDAIPLTVEWAILPNANNP